MMQDPMAGLTSGGDNNNNTVTTSSTNSKQVIDGMALQLNMKRLDRIRSVMSITSGCIAGILGCTGLQGLVFFLASHTFVCVIMAMTKMSGMSLQTYTQQTWFGYWTEGFQPTALSFTLFWTLFYGLVYLF
ncbi:hypothetical protein FisN_6Hu038 [Fistulifera solaris]|uniref:ER membrane protein complex subunit 6 n=1 Tax=Fistulifera solaris TaxID=1519565 RepID=A0A1Z5KHY3_FISSO|nr:hypothetical protein FisN_6Hu038 [Fistulifera solaris]|eukprot:GAX25924.1 hypothetical protein FisN_6Hu038 [Fistulifera solaris]